MGALMQNVYGKDWISINMARKVREQAGDIAHLLHGIAIVRRAAHWQQQRGSRAPLKCDCDSPDVCIASNVWPTRCRWCCCLCRRMSLTTAGTTSSPHPQGPRRGTRWARSGPWPRQRQPAAAAASSGRCSASRDMRSPRSCATYIPEPPAAAAARVPRRRGSSSLLLTSSASARGRTRPMHITASWGGRACNPTFAPIQALFWTKETRQPDPSGLRILQHFETRCWSASCKTRSHSFTHAIPSTFCVVCEPAWVWTAPQQQNVWRRLAD